MRSALVIIIFDTIFYRWTELHWLNTEWTTPNLLTQLLKRPDSDQARWAIREIKSFLDSYRKWIHSLLLFGSYALGQAGRHSDVDFLVLLKNGEKGGWSSVMMVIIPSTGDTQERK